MSFLSQLSWRYATKKFDTTKKVSSEQLTKILEAIKMAPTSYGVQPFHVVVVTNPELREKLKTAGYGQAQITDSSHLMVFCARTDILDRVNGYFEIASGGNAEVRSSMKGYEDMMSGALGAISEDKKEAWAAKQAYLALGFGLAACAELEVDACPMEGFNPAEFKSILGLPENMYPHALMAVGFRSSEDKVHAKVRFNDLFENRD
jgi:nitroreductase